MQRTRLRLDHSLSLSTQQLHRLEQVDDALIPHPLENNAQRYEDTRSSDARAKYNNAVRQAKFVFYNNNNNNNNNHHHHHHHHSQ